MEELDIKEWLKRRFRFTDEQCKMYDLLTQLWHLTYLSNKEFAEVLRRIVNEVENV